MVYVLLADGVGVHLYSRLVDAVENAEVAEIKRAVFRALTRLRAATIKEFAGLKVGSTSIIDISYSYFSLVLGYIDADLRK